jgi:hypothetical protein
MSVAATAVWRRWMTPEDSIPSVISEGVHLQ